MELLEKTIRQMHDVFTSNQFNAKAIENGYPKELVKRKGLSKFLHRHATNGEEFSKTWTKIKKREIYNEKIIDKENISEDEAIKKLKSLGYKILKPKTEFQEV